MSLVAAAAAAATTADIPSCSAPLSDEDHHQHHHHHAEDKESTGVGNFLPTPVAAAKPEPLVFALAGSPEAAHANVIVKVHNVVCNFTLPLHIDLRRLARSSSNVHLEHNANVLLKQRRRPACWARIFSTGKVYIVGCKSETDILRAARTLARSVQRAMGRLGDKIRLRQYRVVNVLATCRLPFGVRIEDLSAANLPLCRYEPELCVAAVWKLPNPKATLQIHTTGSISVTGATSERDAILALETVAGQLLRFGSAERFRPAAGGGDEFDETALPRITIKPEPGDEDDELDAAAEAFHFGLWAFLRESILNTTKTHRADVDEDVDMKPTVTGRRKPGQFGDPPPAKRRKPARRERPAPTILGGAGNQVYFSDEDDIDELEEDEEEEEDIVHR